MSEHREPCFLPFRVQRLDLELTNSWRRRTASLLIVLGRVNGVTKRDMRVMLLELVQIVRYKNYRRLQFVLGFGIQNIGCTVHQRVEECGQRLKLGGAFVYNWL